MEQAIEAARKKGNLVDKPIQDILTSDKPLTKEEFDTFNDYGQKLLEGILKEQGRK